MQRPWRYHFSRLWFPCFSVGVLVYFIYHLISGEHGFVAWKALSQELDASSVTLAAQEAMKEALEKDVQMLSSDSLDLDLLDERIRVMLNHAQDNEIVVLLD